MNSLIGRLVGLAAIVISAAAYGNAALGAGTGTIEQLPQFVSTTSPSSAITQATYGKALKITGLSTGQCLTLDGNNLLTTTGAVVEEAVRLVEPSGIEPLTS